MQDMAVAKPLLDEALLSLLSGPGIREDAILTLQAAIQNAVILGQMQAQLAQAPAPAAVAAAAAAPPPESSALESVVFQSDVSISDAALSERLGLTSVGRASAHRDHVSVAHSDASTIASGGAVTAMRARSDGETS